MSDLPLIRELLAEIEQLWRSPDALFVGIRRIARQVMVEANDATDLTEIPFEASPATRDERSYILSSAINAAKFAAWNCGQYLPLTYEAEVTVCAVLLADAGLLLTTRTKGTQANDRDERHPLLGAALAARMQDGPSALPQLIARHHERNDGSGAPMKLTADRLTRAERHVALTIRFSELFNGDPKETLLKLHDEARSGLFDAELTGNVLRSIIGRMPEGVSFNQKMPSNWATTDLGRKRFQLHASHSSPSPPHFDTSRRLKTVARIPTGRT